MTDKNSQPLDDEQYEDNEDHQVDEVKQKIKKLKKKLAHCEKEKGEYLLGWQRSQADLINLRKKDTERLERSVENANEELVESLLPVLDSFEAAMANKESWEAVPEVWRKGIEFIYAELTAKLKATGLETVECTGQFDPELHEAVRTETSNNHKEGEIIKVVQQGYTFKSKPLRNARVIVAE